MFPRHHEDFESVLFKDKASVVVSGRLGWNALDWATAPGLHFPCAGGKYPDQSTETPDPGSALTKTPPASVVKRSTGAKP